MNLDNLIYFFELFIIIFFDFNFARFLTPKRN